MIVEIERTKPTVVLYMQPQTEHDQVVIERFMDKCPEHVFGFGSALEGKDEHGEPTFRKSHLRVAVEENPHGCIKKDATI